MKKMLYLFLFLIASPLLAGEFLTGDSVTLSNPIESDVYAAGGDVESSSTIGGDLTVAGGTVRVNGAVHSDLTAAGGSIFANGPVEDDAWLAGGTVYLNGSVGGDAILVAGTINVPGEVRIKGDLVAAGGIVHIEGSTEGKVFIAGGEAILSGEMGGPLVVSGDTIQINGTVRNDATIRAKKSLVIGPDAHFEGSVRFWTPSGKANFAQSLAPEKAVYDPSLALNEYQSETSGNGFFGFFLFGSGILVIGLLLFLFPAFFRNSGSWLRSNPATALGAGVLYFLLTPVVSIILMILVIGIPLGLFLGSVYAFSFVFALPISSLVLAESLRVHLQKTWTGWPLFAVAVALLLLISLLSMIPVLGWLLLILIALGGTGAVLAGVVHSYRGSPGEQPLTYSI